jgi:hypothetical protein
MHLFVAILSVKGMGLETNFSKSGNDEGLFWQAEN